MKIKAEWVSVPLSIILIFIPMFSEEIRNIILLLDWKGIMFILGLIALAFSLLSLTIRKLFEREYKTKYSELLKKIDDLTIQNKNDRKNCKLALDDFYAISRINYAIIRNNFIVPLEDKEINELAETLYSYFEKECINIPDWERYFKGKEYKDIINALEDVAYKKKREREGIKKQSYNSAF